MPKPISRVHRGQEAEFSQAITVPNVSGEAAGIESFLRDAALAGCIRVELRQPGPGGIDEATSIVRSWPINPGEDKGLALAQMTRNVIAVGQEDALASPRGQQRYLLTAWTAEGPWGRHALAWGRDASQRDNFSEADATPAGLVAELVRDRRESQRMAFQAFQVVINRLSERDEADEILKHKNQEMYFQLLEANDTLRAKTDERDIARSKIRSQERMVDKMTDAVVPLLKPIVNAAMGYVTGEPAVLAAPMLEDLADLVFEDESMSIGKKLLEAFPPEKHATLLSLLDALEKSRNKRLAQKKADEEKEAEEKAQREAPGPTPITAREGKVIDIHTRPVQS